MTPITVPPAASQASATAPMLGCAALADAATCWGRADCEWCQNVRAEEYPVLAGLSPVASAEFGAAGACAAAGPLW